MLDHEYTIARRGVTVVELLVCGAALSSILSVTAVTMQDAGDAAKVTVSLTNLRNFGTAHATYSAEWDGRQITFCPDDLSSLLDGDGFPSQYPKGGKLKSVPAVPLGFTRDGDHIQTREAWAIQPFWVGENGALGSFRAFNTKPFAVYLNGKVYDPIFFAPKDRTLHASLGKWMEDPGEWPRGVRTFFLSTYCMSPAAMVSPDVFDGDNVGDIRELAAGFRSPSLSQARFPDLKTHMLEHEWLQNAPESKFIDGTGHSWVYNLSEKSQPATLFFDGHVRMMSVREAIESNSRVVAQTGKSIWTSGAGPVHPGGYFQEHAVDEAKKTNYHVFTTDGIQGRDTIGYKPVEEKPDPPARNARALPIRDIDD